MFNKKAISATKLQFTTVYAANINAYPSAMLHRSTAAGIGIPDTNLNPYMVLVKKG